MSKNKFDDLLLRKFQEENFPYKKESWDKLAQLLPPGQQLSGQGLKNRQTQSGKWRVAVGIAAGIAILFSLLLVTGVLNRQAVNEASPVAKISGPRDVRPETTEGQAPASRTRQALNPALSLADEERAETVGPKRLEEGLKTPPATALLELPAKAGAVQSNAAEKTRPEPPVPARSIQQQEEASDALAQSVSDLDKQTYYNSLLPSPEVSAAAPPSRTIVSVGGGVNYGTLNTGYALGVSAKQKVGDRFFVEGSVGMIYNNNARNVADYNTISGFNAAARPSAANAMKLNSPALSPIENLYYFQVNPAVGYEIDEQFSVSIGGDLQHLITAHAESPKVQYSAEKVFIFPVLDFGLTGKTEFSISPEIQAGIIYREGLSAWLRSDPGTAYLNRRYIQVQFKYSLPLGK